jgi:hypothetical protein
MIRSVSARLSTVSVLALVVGLSGCGRHDAETQAKATATCGATPLQWTFETGSDGFRTEVEDGFTGADATAGAGLAHGGSQSLRVASVQSRLLARTGELFRPFVGLVKEVCDRPIDPSGIKASAFVFFDGPNIPPPAEDNGLSAVPSCTIAFRGWGRVFAAEAARPLAASFTHLVAAQWLKVEGVFPPVDNLNSWMTNPLSIELFCNPVGNVAGTWQGTMYVDDVSIE